MHVFTPPPGTPDDQRDLAVLRTIDKFFGPFAPEFILAAGEPWARWYLANIVSADERRPFRDADPEEIAIEDVDFICDIMKIDPEEICQHATAKWRLSPGMTRKLHKESTPVSPFGRFNGFPWR
jgi:hypothetical protein